MLGSEATASFDCHGCHQLHLNPKRRIPKESAEGWKAIDSRDLTKNASFRSYGTFAYLLRAHIRNINMRRYITSARGHELSGRVRAHIARGLHYLVCLSVCVCVCFPYSGTSRHQAYKQQLHSQATPALCI